MPQRTPPEPVTDPPTEGGAAAAGRRRDQRFIKAAAVVAVAAILVWTLSTPGGAARAIGVARTFITEYFTWYFVLLAALALAVCGWIAFGRYGAVRLGGPRAKPEYSRFAWYSMLFACGQGIGLIFWSVAEPIMLKETNPLSERGGVPAVDGAMAWSYFHWGITAWALYCIVAVCLAYSHHNAGQPLTFRGAAAGLFPHRSRRGVGIAIELVAILATVLGLATSFGFAAMQFSAGFATATGVPAGQGLRITVVLALGALAAVSVFFGIKKGMKRISEMNSVLSITLIVAVLVFGPTVYLLSTLSQTTGVYIENFVSMSLWTDSTLAASGIEGWQDSWNGSWTVFIWCWCLAFSPFVGAFVARISRGRTLREFVVGMIAMPSLIVVVWIGVIGGAAVYYDDLHGGTIGAAVEEDTAQGLFAMLQNVPVVGGVLLVLATLLVATYYVTSLDSGVHALSDFVASEGRSGAGFRVVLVAMIVAVTLVLLTLGGTGVVDTVQTGTILGAFPFTLVVIVLVVNLVRRLRRQEVARHTVTEPDPPPAQHRDDGLTWLLDETCPTHVETPVP